MTQYLLSASLEGHEDDVRSVIYPSPSSVYTASRDGTVRQWILTAASHPPRYDCTISSHVDSYVNAVAYLPPTGSFTNGLVVSGCKDTIVQVRDPKKSLGERPDGLLLGHAHNVCALDTSQNAKFIVSGSWDGTARIWNVGTWECEAVLTGHDGSVWSVLAYNEEIVITDCMIRIFDIRGKQHGQFAGSKEVIRALCRLPKSQSNSADIASAGNDGIVSLWKLTGELVGQLRGHEGFIYCLASDSSGQIFSSSEDRTVRVWREMTCVQTIVHPAVSVWSVALCPQTGDLVTGTSDNKARVFTLDKQRLASPDVIKAFEDSIGNYSIPKQQVDSKKTEQLPGPEFLTQKSGTKEGQVQMIRELDGSVTAHQWSVEDGAWKKIGTVVDGVGTGKNKTTHGGKDYDYVFDVDIKDGVPPLKLPYSITQNPYEAATKFLEANELPVSYLDQVANFIVQNTEGHQIGHVETLGSHDIWGTESRYRPGQPSPTSSAPPGPDITARPVVLPQRNFLAIKNANTQVILQKIIEFDAKARNDGLKDATLSEEDLRSLRKTTEGLNPAISQKSTDADAFKDAGPILLRTLKLWPPEWRVPVLDLVRLLCAASAAVARVNDPENAVSALLTSGFEDAQRENNIMLAVRALGNLFETEPGQNLVKSEFERIFSKIRPHLESSHKNLTIAISTLQLNFSVLIARGYAADPKQGLARANTILQDSSKLLERTSDPETAYRALVAIGTLLSIEDPAILNDRQKVTKLIDLVEKKFEEERMKIVIQEMYPKLRR